MKYITNREIEQTFDGVVTIGNFDGFHLGHRALIEQTKEFAIEKGLQSIVFTFFPHPKYFFRKQNDFAMIFSKEEKKHILNQLDIDCYIEYPFDEMFAKTSPEEFVYEILKKKLRCRVLVVGEDYHFGANRIGNMDLLKRLGKECGIEVVAVSSVMWGNEKISSTRLRRYLTSREEALFHTKFFDIEAMLAQPYFVMGRVNHGKEIGRTIGFPTINMKADSLKLLPPNGVYITKVLVRGKLYEGVTNVGVNPTVNGTEQTIETHILEFQDMIYGEMVQIFFYDFIRYEKKFDSLEDLKKEIQCNQEQTKEFFRQLC